MFWTTFLALLVLNHQANGLELKACKVKDDQCLKDAIQDAFGQLKNGDPKYNIPSIDPVVVPESTIGAGTGVVHLVQHYYNLTLSGFSKTQLHKAHMDFDKLVLTFSGKTAEVQITANYEMEGRLLVLPVKGKGPCSMISTNVIGHHRIEFKKQEKNGDVYYIPKSYDVQMTPGGLVFKFENLFDGNKLLGDNVNKLLNEEWSAVYKDVGRNYETNLAKFCLMVVKAVFSNIPAKALFLQ